MIQSWGLTGDDRQIRGVTTLVTRTEASVDWSWWQTIIIKSPRQLYHFAAFMFRTLQCGGHSGWCLVIGCWWPLVMPPGSVLLVTGCWVSGPGLCDPCPGQPGPGRLGQHRAVWRPGPGPELFILCRPVECHPSQGEQRIESRDTSDTSHRSVRRQRHGAFLDEYFPTFCISVFY